MYENTVHFVELYLYNIFNYVICYTLSPKDYNSLMTNTFKVNKILFNLEMRCFEGKKKIIFYINQIFQNRSKEIYWDL